MKKIAIFGSQEYLAGQLNAHLTSAGHDVYLLDSRLNKSVTTEKASLPKSESNQDIICNFLSSHEVDYIINCLDVPFAERKLVTAHNINIGWGVTQVCLTYFKNLSPEKQNDFRYMICAPYSIYGSIEEGSFNESSNYAPSSLYSAAMSAINMGALALFKCNGLPVVSTVSSSIYGLGQEHATNLINYTLGQIFNDKHILLSGNGRYVRDFIYIKDWCRAIELIIASGGGEPGENYCIGSGKSFSMREVVDIICDALHNIVTEVNCTDLIKFSGGGNNYDKRRALDCSKMHRVFNFDTEYSLEAGIKDFISCFMQSNNMVI